MNGRRGAMGLDIWLIFKIAGIGIIVSVLYMVLKQAGKEEHGHLMALAGVMIVLMMVVELIANLFRTVKTIFM